jgi:hypothetical protein
MTLYNGVTDTAVTLDLIFERMWLPLKGISIEKTHIGKLTRDRVLSHRCHGHRCDDFIDFLLELEAIFKKALTRVLGA